MFMPTSTGGPYMGGAPRESMGERNGDRRLQVWSPHCAAGPERGGAADQSK